MLFDRQVEETELEGRLKQRRHLLNLSSQGVQQVRNDLPGRLFRDGIASGSS